MRKLFYIINFLLCIAVHTQNPQAEELVKIHSVTSTEMNAITSPIEGTLTFNLDDQHTYQYSGTKWQRLVVEKDIIKPLTGNYTLTADDDKCVLTFNSNTDVSLRVPKGLPIGYNVSIYQIGKGRVTIIGSGTTIRNRSLRYTTAGLDAAVGILCTGTNTFHVSGDLKR